MAYGRSLLDVAHDPWRVTLFAFAMMREHEMIVGRVQRVTDARTMHGTAVAFHDPKRIADMERAALTALMAPRVSDREYVRQKAEELERLAREGNAREVDDHGC